MASLRIRDDLEEAESSHVQARSDAHNNSTIEPLERSTAVNAPHPDQNPSLPIPQKKTVTKKWHIKTWHQISDLFSDWWLEELLSVLISIVSFIAIVIVLRKYDDQPLPKLPHDVSVSFVVSALATISKSSLLLAVSSAIGQFKWIQLSTKHRPLQSVQVIDEASRGPLGAFKLLASRLSMSWLSIGAIVVLLCLIYDPFIQGLISTPGRVVYKDDQASELNTIIDFPTFQYNITDYPPSKNLVVDLAADYRLVNAIDDAISTRSILLETQPRCPTGNCTWPIFTSLGFCYDCQNITLLMQNVSTFTDYQEFDESSPINFRNWTYTLPELAGQVLKFVSGETSFEATIDLGQAVYIASLTSFYVLPLSWEPMTAYNFINGTSIPAVTLIAFLRASTQFNNPGSINLAEVCALRFCAQKRNVSVTLNQLSSVVVETVYGTLASTDNNSYIAFNGNDINITYPSSLSRLKSLDADPRDAPWYEWSSGLLYLNQHYAGNRDLRKDQPLEQPEGFQESTIYALEQSTDFSVTMNNFATALTNHFRDSSPDTMGGQSGRSEVYIRVTWPWLALPAFLVATGTAFLFLAMFETKRAGVQVWKTSQLPLLFHGMTDGDLEQEDSAANDRQSEMEHLAGKTKVKMVNTGGHGWMMMRQEKGDTKTM